MSSPGAKYAAVREVLKSESPSALWVINHCDITCDGCETEPVVGRRYKCTVCEDIDLCDGCMRALVAARIKMAAAAVALPPPPPPGRRPRKWVSKLHSRDLLERWAALQEAVPCLHPSHQFQKVVDGPEREVVFQPGSCSSRGGARSTGAAAATALQQKQQQQQETDEAMRALSIAEAPGSSSRADAALEEFLATFPPSACSCRDVAWIVVAHPDARDSDMQQQRRAGQQEAPAGAATPPQQPGKQEQLRSGSASLEERVDAAVEEWERVVKAAAASGKRVTSADVDALAVRHGILKGKWLLFARSGAEADVAWAAVARAVCGGPGPGQAPLCGSAKVSSAGPEGDSSWVLCAYTSDYTDQADVQRVCRGLQQAVPPGLLQDRRLLYKPDIYTHLGIYSKNEWQLKPTIREARLA